MEKWFISFEVVNQADQRGKGHGFYDRLPHEKVEDFTARIMDLVANKHGCDLDKVVIVSIYRIQ